MNGTKLMLLATLTLFIGNVSFGQQQVPLPKVNYEQYGSLGNQLTVYRRLQNEADAAYWEKVRRIREELDRTERTRVITVNDRNTYRCNVGRRNYSALRPRPICKISLRVKIGR